jgi:hypothetical protein
MDTLENAWTAIADRGRWELAIVQSYDGQHDILVVDESGGFTFAENMNCADHAELIARTINAACAASLAARVAQIEAQRLALQQHEDELRAAMRHLLNAEAGIGVALMEAV